MRRTTPRLLDAELLGCLDRADSLDGHGLLGKLPAPRCSPYRGSTCRHARPQKKKKKRFFSGLLLLCATSACLIAIASNVCGMAHLLTSLTLIWQSAFLSAMARVQLPTHQSSVIRRDGFRGKRGGLCIIPSPDYRWIVLGDWGDIGTLLQGS